MPPGEKKPLLQRVLPNSMESVVQQVPDLTQSGFATEAAPPKTDEYEPNIRGGTPGVSGGEKAGDSPVSGKFLKKPPKPPENIGTIKGTITSGLTEEEAAIYAQAERNVFEAEQRTAIAEGAAMGFSEQLLSDYANIAHMDALEGRRLHQEHFTKAKSRMDSLYKKVEEASAMQVNPYNWHESVGRGGRVAAAFALLTGQMAAGAGNPNSSLKMMEAAIERDIAAQEQNIKAKFDTLKMQRNLSVDERALFQEEINSLNETRAVAYSAISGRIAAAKQHAINEAHYAAYDVMDDHFNMKKLDAIRAARENIFIEVEQGTNASKLRMQLRQIEAMKAQIVPGAPLQGATAGAPSQPSTPGAETSARTLKPAPGRAGAVRARTGSRPAGATQPTGRVESVDAAQGSVAGTATPRQIEDIGTGMSRMQTQEEADKEFAEKQAMEREAKSMREKRPETLQDLGRKAYHGSPVTEEEVAHVITKSRREGGSDISKEVADAGGFGLAYQLKITGEGTAKTTSIAEALNDIAAGLPIRHGGMLMNQDADLVSLMAPEPDARLYPKELVERNGKMVRVHGAAYHIAHKAWEYGREFEEIYETRATVEGQRNTVTAGGMSFKLAEGAVARTNEKRYLEMADKLAEVSSGMNSTMALAKAIRKNGLSGIFTGDGTFNIPGFNTDDPFTMGLANDMITNAMKFIKKHDPTARISDKDLEVGMKAMGDFLTKGGKAMDFIQSLDGNSFDNTKRKQIERFLITIALESQRMAFEKYENEMVPDYNTSMKVADEARELQKYIDRKQD